MNDDQSKSPIEPGQADAQPINTAQSHAVAAGEAHDLNAAPQEKHGIWRRTYDAMIAAAGHKHAEPILGITSIAESSFFPIPVDVMLAPMVMARPDRTIRLALLTTICSVIGGVIGFFIGAFLIETATPILKDMNYWAAYQTASSWFVSYGVIAVFIAGFTPVPYKVFTIAAGAGGMALLPFIAASCVGRGMRFFLVALLVRWAGPKMEDRLLQYADRIGWSVLALLAVGGAIYYALRPA